MVRIDVNRFGEMEVFVAAVEQGGFSAAARALQLTPSAISKLMTRLEARLGARLLNRSTRKLQLTPEGCVFFERARAVLANLDEAEQAARASEVSRGNVAISANVPFGTHFLLPLLPAFQAAYPEVSLDLHLSDTVVDLLGSRVDIAIRAGPLKSSGLVARKLGETRKVVVAAPAYLGRTGTPKTPNALAQHNLLGSTYQRAVSDWPFIVDGKAVTVAATGTMRASDGEALRQLALAGLGLARLSAFQVAGDIKAKRLIAVLEKFNPGDRETFYAVYLGQGGHLSARIRAVLDFLAAKVRLR
nr:LysR family transcriptional regulator [uncultured Dongia sp.]